MELIEVVRKAIEIIDDKALAHEVVMALVANAVAISKEIGSGEDEFFDMVVRMYGWTHVEIVEHH